MFSRFRAGNGVFGHKLTAAGCAAYCNVNTDQLEHALDYMLKNSNPARHLEIIHGILRLQSSPSAAKCNTAVAQEAGDILFAVHVREKVIPLVEACGPAEDKEAFVFERLAYFDNVDEQRKWFTLTVSATAAAAAAAVPD